MCQCASGPGYLEVGVVVGGERVAVGGQPVAVDGVRPQSAVVEEIVRSEPDTGRQGLNRDRPATQRNDDKVGD